MSGEPGFGVDEVFGMGDRVARLKIVRLTG